MTFSFNTRRKKESIFSLALWLKIRGTLDIHIVAAECILWVLALNTRWVGMLKSSCEGLQCAHTWQRNQRNDCCHNPNLQKFYSNSTSRHFTARSYAESCLSYSISVCLSVRLQGWTWVMTRLVTNTFHARSSNDTLDQATSISLFLNSLSIFCSCCIE